MIAKKRQNLNNQIAEYQIIDVVELLRGILAFASILSLYFKLSNMVVENVVY